MSLQKNNHLTAAWYKALVPVMDYEDMARFHCHILEHKDVGMFGIWNIGMGM